MADRASEGGERKSEGGGVPPRKPPIVPPTVPPLARPLVPPTVPPVMRPVSPAPAAAPLLRPIQPVSAPAPVLRPVSQAPAPVMKPVAPAAAPAAPTRSGGSRSSKSDDDSPRGRSSRAAAPAKAGMSTATKVGLATFVTSALIIAIAVLPGMKSGAASDGRAEFEIMGSNAARAYASALTKDATSTSSGANKKDLDSFVKSADEQLKTLKVATEGRESVMALMGVAIGLAADPSGASAKGPLDQLISALEKRIEKTKDDDDKTALRTERGRLIEIYQKLGSAGPAPEAGAKTRLYTLPVAGTSPLRAAWLASPKGEIIGESSAALPWPPKPAGDNSGRYTATVGGIATTVFYAQGNAMMPIAFLAFDDPAPRDAGGGSKLGLLMLILGPILLGFVGSAVAGSAAKPIKDLARELDRLGSAGDPTRRINAHGAEASAVARSVERMVANLKFRDSHAMQDLSEVVSKEQELAGQIHHGLMPKDPPRLAGYEVETLFKPGFEIGGDHFDYFRIDDTHLGVILMDTSVRGIPAALVMAMARAYVRAEAPGVLSPAEVLMKVNRLLAADLSQGQYVTALYVVIDTSAGSAKVASAGHLPLVVYRHAIGKTAVVNPQGVALGLDVGPVFDREITEVEVEIGVGDRLVLHTDGALKVQSETGDEYGEARLYASIKQEAPKNSQAFVNFVGGTIDQFHLTTPQNDDITISTVKRLK